MQCNATSTTGFGGICGGMPVIDLHILILHNLISMVDLYKLLYLYCFHNIYIYIFLIYKHVVSHYIFFHSQISYALFVLTDFGCLLSFFRWGPKIQQCW